MIDIPERLARMEPLWGAWTITDELGEGGYGKVYKIERREFGGVYTAALKYMAIPRSQSEVRELYSQNLSEEQIRTHYQYVAERLHSEVQLMSSLAGNSYVVDYLDHMIVQRQDDIGFDILIRMELLTPLTDYLMQHPFTECDVTLLGLHICRALELCERRHIIHRDIKPQNVFRSQDGDFKLGDFGTARVREHTLTEMTRAGTLPYMAPEVDARKEGDIRADIYSLGLMLYKLLNKNRLPFYPVDRPPTAMDHEQAHERRLRGEALPEPACGNEAIKKIILKASQHDADARYRTPAEMAAALEAVLKSGKDLSSVVLEPAPSGMKLKTPSERSVRRPLTEGATLPAEGSLITDVSSLRNTEQLALGTQRPMASRAQVPYSQPVRTTPQSEKSNQQPVNPGTPPQLGARRPAPPPKKNRGGPGGWIAPMLALLVLAGAGFVSYHFVVDTLDKGKDWSVQTFKEYVSDALSPAPTEAPDDGAELERQEALEDAERARADKEAVMKELADEKAAREAAEAEAAKAQADAAAAEQARADLEAAKKRDDEEAEAQMRALEEEKERQRIQAEAEAAARVEAQAVTEAEERERIASASQYPPVDDYNGRFRTDQSSYLTNNKYPVDGGRVADGDLNTAWNEGAKGIGQNEFVTLKVPGDQKCRISGFRIVNGYTKSDSVFYANNRVKRIQVAIDGTDVGYYDLEDTKSWQTVYLGNTYIGSRVRFYIDEAYRGNGKNSNDTAITEIELFADDSTDYVTLPYGPVVPDEGVVYEGAPRITKYTEPWDCPSDEYLSPNMNKVKFTLEEVNQVSSRMLAFIRNEAVARHGQAMARPEYAEYFESRTWYRLNHVRGEAALESIEDYNCGLMLQVEKARRGN